MLRTFPTKIEEAEFIIFDYVIVTNENFQECTRNCEKRLLALSCLSDHRSKQMEQLDGFS